MATISNLPEELLFMMFEHFDSYELKRLQKVCTAWYRPAHHSLLKKIDLLDLRDIQLFIASIDSNPDPSYLNAVKTINICIIDYRFHDDENQKLYYRFPNLEHIKIAHHHYAASSYQRVTDEMCQSFLTSCTKLKTFEIENYSCQLLYNLRLLLTSINLDRLDTFEEPTLFGDAVQYISGFSRLKVIDGHYHQLDNFLKYVQVFEHLPDLTSISLTEKEEEPSDAESYLMTKSKQNQNQIKERLSKVCKLVWYRWNSFSLESVQFVGKYFTGLESLEMYCYHNSNWNDQQRLLLCSSIMDLVRSVKQKFCVYLGEMKFGIMSKDLPLITHTMFYNMQLKMRILQVNIIKKSNSVNTVDLCMDSTPFQQELDVSISDEFSILEVALNLFKDTKTLDGIDIFVLSMRDRENYTREASIKSYEKLLEGLPSVKEVTFDMPDDYIDNKWASDTVYPQVETLTVRTRKDTKFKNFLNRFAFALPNLKHLNICYSSGIWDTDVGEFLVRLPKYTLEKLSLDVTSVKEKMNELEGLSESFFVVLVSILGNSKRYLYKVDSSYFSRSTTINDQDLEGLSLGKDYIRVRIVVQNLKSLELCESYDDDSDYFHHPDIDDRSYFDDPEVLRFTLFNNN